MGANGDNFRGALLFSIFTCLIYVLEPLTDNKGCRRIQFTRLEGGNVAAYKLGKEENQGENSHLKGLKEEV